MISTLLRKKLCALLCLSTFTLSAFSQTNVTKIYTDFGGYWSTDSSIRNPNTAHNLLGFTVGMGNGARVFSTGVDDELLTAKGINYTAVNYRALPVALGSRSGSSYFIGTGSRYNNIWQPPQPSYQVPNYQTPEYYLQNGKQGLDLGSAVFNIPSAQQGISNVGVSYQVDQFNISRIGDSIPDIVVTQVGEPPAAGSDDIFRFVDANGNTVGNAITVSLRNLPSVGTAHWAFYNLPGSGAGTTGAYASPQPGLTNAATETQRRTNFRQIRFLQWDLSAFGLNTSNIENVTRFVHQLNGSSDPAFIAYNTSAFRALSDFTAGCDINATMPVWFQSNRGITTSGNNLVSWQNDGSNGQNATQTTPTQQPQYQATSTGTNYRPYVHFTPGKRLTQTNTPFSNNRTGNFEAFVVARPVSTTGSHKIVGFRRSGSGSADSTSLWLNANGALEFRNNSSTTLLTGDSPGVNNTGIWRVSYSNTGSISISLNGGAPVTATIPNLSPLPHWFTEYGNSTSTFDLSEIMFFSDNLSAAERQRIQSYLSIKYGIHYAANYIGGTGNVIWEQNNEGYNSRIFGIGREDCQGMAQRQAHSVTVPAQDIVAIGLNSIAPSNAANSGNIPDAHYIIWGDNNASLNALENIRSAEHCLLAPQRRWRAQTTGNLANTLPTQVIINTADITWSNRSTVAGDYFLLIDRNGNGLYNDPEDSAIPATAINGNTLTFNDVLWDTDNNASDLFTVGFRQATPNAGPDQTQAGTSFTMNAAAVAGIWTVVSRDPENAVINIANPTSYNTQVTVANGTITTLRWTPSTPGAYCFDEVVLTNTIPLPVTWVYFTATAANEQVKLEWKTAQEENNNGFYVEYSKDGTNFSTVGFVTGKNEAATYHFVQENITNGIHFYRLKQVDYDGKYTYSSVQRVDTENQTTIYISPNPVINILTIHHLPLQSPIEVYTAEGKLLYKGLYQPLSVTDWKPGVYLVRVSHLNQIKTLRFVKL